MPILATWLKSDEQPVSKIERRLSLRFQDYWNGLRGRRPLPLISDLSLSDIEEFLPNSYNLDLRAKGGEARFRFIGREIARDCGREVTNLGLDDLLPHCVLARTLRHREKVIRLKKPYIVSDEFTDSRGFKTLFRGIMTPFSVTGERVDFIMGAISWKTVDLSEAAETLRDRPAPNPADIDRRTVAEDIAEMAPHISAPPDQSTSSERRMDASGLLVDVSKAVAEWAPDGPGTERGRESIITAGGSQAGTGRVIVLGSLKGGTGKSTTAMHLIVSLLSRGHKVASIDLDSPQASLTRYLENRKNLNRRRNMSLSMPDHLAMSDRTHDSARLEEVIGGLTDRCDFVVIDTPGSDTAISRAAHAWADCLVTPINDSFVDLDILAVMDPDSHDIIERGHYADLVVRAQTQKAARCGRSFDWIVLRNRLSNLDARNKQKMAVALEGLAKHLDFRVGSGLSERVIYRELFLMGLTLLDLGGADSSVTLSMSHVAARQELRRLFETIQPPAAVRAGRG
jgi:chromosome partitioning protein